MSRVEPARSGKGAAGEQQLRDAGPKPPRRPPPPPSFLHSIPHGLAECRSEWAAVRRTWAARRDLPLSEAGMYALFAGEVFAWFCVGEIVGRGFTFGGYAV